MVLAARPDVAIFHGLLPSATDVVFIRPGTIHALGAELNSAEVQQNSDTTYRLWDYNSSGLDGELRSLNIAYGLAVSNIGQAPDAIRPIAGTLDCPTPLGELPKGIRVGYACIGDGGVCVLAGPHDLTGARRTC